jgi:hypothetical protein
VEYVFPEIKIEFADRLYDSLSRDFYPFVEEKYGKKLSTPDEIKERVKKYRESWKPREKQILQGIQESLQLQFLPYPITVHVVPFPNSISTPLIISSGTGTDYFIDILTHELIHQLFSDNESKVEWYRIPTEMYPEEKNGAVRIHIIVHAAHKHIYLNVLSEPKRLERDLEKSQKSPIYKKAWEIVERDGYKEIIEKFKSYYKSSR